VAPPYAAIDFERTVNGVTLRFRNSEPLQAGIHIDLSSYAIPLIKLLGAATTRDEIKEILNRFGLERDARGEVSVGLSFVEALAGIYATHQAELQAQASA